MDQWQLRFPANQIRAWADQYQYEDDVPVLDAGRRARDAGCFGFDDFLMICRWKTPRSQSHCRKNTAEEVAEISRIALATPIERLRIGVLRCLHGVNWPTASVLLHLAHRDPYPILDFRAMWSLGFEQQPTYNDALWSKYVNVCRRLATEHRVQMRTLDRAMWQYSKVHQGTDR